MPPTDSSLPRLRIETSALDAPPPRIVVDEHGAQRQDTLAVPVPGPRTPTREPRSASFLRPRPSPTAPTGKGGVQFLLQDVLRKLRERPKPPPSYDAADVPFDTEVAFTLVSHLYEVLRTADSLSMRLGAMPPAEKCAPAVIASQPVLTAPGLPRPPCASCVG
jgi:hypothetical protein